MHRRNPVGQAGLELAACGNTVKSQNVTPRDLLPASLPPRATVARIAELQSQGHLYLKR